MVFLYQWWCFLFIVSFDSFKRWYREFDLLRTNVPGVSANWKWSAQMFLLIIFCQEALDFSERICYIWSTLFILEACSKRTWTISFFLSLISTYKLSYNILKIFDFHLREIFHCFSVKLVVDTSRNLENGEESRVQRFAWTKKRKERTATTTTNKQ